MNILHVLDHSLPHYDGYAFRSWEIIRFERQNNIITRQLTSPKHVGAKTKVETAEGIEFHRSTASTNPLYHLPVLDQVGVVRGLRHRLRDMVETQRPDIIHVHSPSLNGLAALSVARAHKIPMIYEVRSFWEDAAVDAGVCREGDLRYRLTRASEDYVVRHATHVVPICRGIATDLEQRGHAAFKMTVVPNSVDFIRFNTHLAYDHDLAARYGLSAGHTLGFAGSFFTFEGLCILIEAVALLVRQQPSLRLLLIGDGVERRELESLARARGIEREVIFTGRVPHADIQSYYGVIDTLVYPRLPMRLTELVTPLKPLEAMAHGKSVIASDVGGHRELIEHEQTGLLFRAGDAPALAESVMRLCGDARLREQLQANARVHVEHKHNWAVTVKKYLEIYQRLAVGSC